MATWTLVSTLVACPSCSTTDLVRDIVFGADFWTNVGVGLLPFTVILAVCVFVHRGT